MCCTGNTKGSKDWVNWYSCTGTDLEKIICEEICTLVRLEKCLGEKHIVCGGFANKLWEKPTNIQGKERSGTLNI